MSVVFCACVSVCVRLYLFFGHLCYSKTNISVSINMSCLLELTHSVGVIWYLREV